jgi:hypothetical protein
MTSAVMTCTKGMYRHESQALAAGFSARRRNISPGWGITAYRCDTCRLKDDKRAWHWGHKRPKRKGGRRR